MFGVSEDDPTSAVALPVPVPVRARKRGLCGQSGFKPESQAVCLTGTSRQVLLKLCSLGAWLPGPPGGCLVDKILPPTGVPQSFP